MAADSSEECQNVHSIVVLPDRDTTNSQYEPLQNAGHVEIPNTKKSEMCSNSEPSLQSKPNLKMEKLNNYVSSILDVDIEKGNAQGPSPNEDSLGNLKSDNSLARTLNRDICLRIGGKLMQLLMKHSQELPKYASRDKLMAERVYDTPTNRSRKYKRSHSFNSRRVVLLFSVMSSLGTIVLIYLALRVKQFADGSVNA